MYHGHYLFEGDIMIRKLFVALSAATLLVGPNALACPKKDAMQHGKMYQKGRLVQEVITAVSKTGLSAAQTKKVVQGISEYKATMQSIKNMRIFPVDSFINDQFDEKNFIAEMSEKSQAKIAAKAALFKYIFAILDDEQRKIFKREYAAPLIEKMIRMNMPNKKGMGMFCHQ